ncbi:transporter substrate-binding domain-containing protein [Legionella fallonii]|uniref:ABC transporter substrate-binding protein n=1 Tax=Legionella fallonii LLAP-10 TaxID=1212491 RepID=A0A098G0V2_9GAMM|nr:transporter substrate-binding domain-containing protein [Legionella fallonii]CEG55594.1 ABC transporter substrate-binding protein [Legionella fallonii LLAP-10]
MKTLVFIILLVSNIVASSAPVSIGVLKFAPPFSSLAGDGNHYYGFTIDLMDNLCKRINEQCIYKSADIKQQYEQLERGDFDLSFLPVPISSKIPEQFIYSLPYLASNGHFLALEDSNIKTVNDIKNYKIGVVHDTLYPIIANSGFAQLNTIKGYATINEVLSALQNREVDVIYVNASVAKYIVNNAIFHFKIVGNRITMGQGYGILALKKNAELIRKINNALLDMEADGTYVKIYKQYFSK